MLVAIWILLFGPKAISAAPTDEFLQIIGENEDIKINDEPRSTIMYIVPSGMPGFKMQKESFNDYIDQNNKWLQNFNKYSEEGYTQSGLTFNIYDDKIREATLALFRILKDLDKETLEKVNNWLTNNINQDMLEYALRLTSLYSYKANNFFQNPPFKRNPKYFINAETLEKANRLKMMNGKFNRRAARINQIYRTDDLITINTNYSGWNLIPNDIENNMNYFREDIGLNSYYYGIQLMSPFWMPNDELDEMNPKHAEHYFYVHQQLFARYLLEREHLKYLNYTQQSEQSTRKSYDPYLRYDNGLSFPVRYPFSYKEEINNDWSRIQSLHILMRECVARGFIVMGDGDKINLTEENHTNLLMKLIRANFDNVKMAKYIRSLYGANGYPADMYNPAPSTLHHPQTNLRDPVYWKMIERAIMYIIEYRKNIEPFSLDDYESDEFSIVEADIPDITTFFEYYQYDIGEGLSIIDSDLFYKAKSVTYAARQKRLQHEPFSFKFTVDSKVSKDVIVRLFLGTQCDIKECFNNKFLSFFELDNYRTKLRRGVNEIVWSSRNSSRYSGDDEYNLELKNSSKYRKGQKYDMYKFPERLIIPKGTEDGMKLKLFVIISEADIYFIHHNEDKSGPSVNKKVVFENDKKPLGFPFHRIANYTRDSMEGLNFAFYDISIYHKKYPVEESGFFSSYLY